MKHSSDFYKVVNAIMNTLRQGDCVAYISGGQGGSGFGLFGPDEDFRELRMHLLDDFSMVEDLDVDDDDFGVLFNEWAEYDQFDSSFDFYEFSKGDSRLQVMVNPDNYVNSYELRDMISDDYDFEAAEITEGMNGYPSCLRGCVLLNGGDTTIEGAQAIADLYGVELVSLRRKDGWQLWESQGTAYELYDFQDILGNRDDNALTFGSFKEYADFLRETASDEMVEDMAAHALIEKAKEIEDKKAGDNEFIRTSTYDISYYELLDRHVSHYSYDTWNYCLALDCMIFD